LKPIEPRENPGGLSLVFVFVFVFVLVAVVVVVWPIYVTYYIDSRLSDPA